MTGDRNVIDMAMAWPILAALHISAHLPAHLPAAN
tara:strand:+ start:1826 stop:1930 length:105 start_codon:yes stop_codon:yes gene_type:complete